MSKATCIRAFLFIFTALLLAIGLGFMVSIVWLMIKSSYYDAITGSKILDIGCVAFAVFVCFTSIVGCFGLCGDRHHLLKLFVVFLFILLVLKVAAIVLWFTHNDKFEDFARNNWDKVSDTSRIIIQEKLSCCSMKGISVNHSSTNDPSCYENRNVSAGLQKRDCFTGLKSWLNENKMIILGTASGVILTEIFIIILVYYTLCAHFEDGNKRNRVIPITVAGHTERRLAGDVQLRDMDSSIDDKMSERKWIKHDHR